MIRGARDLPCTRSRWMSLIREITGVCTHTPGAASREPPSHQTDEPAGPAHITSTHTYTRRGGGGENRLRGGSACSFLRACVRINIHLESEGCVHRAERGRVRNEIREIIFI